MKTTLLTLLISSLFIFSNCSKSNDNEPTPPPAPINCDGLVTDTAGSVDFATIYFPNAFTPNGDGLNEISRPFVTGVASISFTIYDVNNNVVFTTTSIGAGWSTSINTNTSEKYYYKIQATTTRGHKIGICGDLYKLSCKPASAPALFFEDQLTANGFTNPTGEHLATCP